MEQIASPLSIHLSTEIQSLGMLANVIFYHKHQVLLCVVP